MAERLEAYKIQKEKMEMRETICINFVFGVSFKYTHTSLFISTLRSSAFLKRRECCEYRTVRIQNNIIVQ